jgi:hypothetical protein
MAQTSTPEIVFGDIAMLPDVTRGDDDDDDEDTTVVKSVQAFIIREKAQQYELMVTIKNTTNHVGRFQTDNVEPGQILTCTILVTPSIDSNFERHISTRLRHTYFDEYTFDISAVHIRYKKVASHTEAENMCSAVISSYACDLNCIQCAWMNARETLTGTTITHHRTRAYTV